MGLADEVGKRYLGAGARVATDKLYHVEEELQLVTLRQHVEAMVLLASGYTVSATIFCIQIMWRKYRKPKIQPK